MRSDSGEVTQLLKRFSAGDRDVENELFQLVYAELHRLAANYLRGERVDPTLQPTALINEAFIRLVGQREKDWANRSHFVAVSAQIMRRILVDFARSGGALKRGAGGLLVPLAEESIPAGADPATIIDVDHALQRLFEIDSRQARIVELRYFAGLSVEETAELLDISPRTVKREWAVARAWLHGELIGNRGQE